MIVELDKSAGMAQLCYVDYEWRHKLQTDRGADGSSSWRALVGKDDEYLSKCGMPLEVAQYYVGVMHALGTHVKARDMGAAKALWVRAAKRGFLPAQKSLQVVPLALVRPLCAFHAPPIGRGMSAVLPERPPLWWRVLPSTYEAMQADARDQERLEKLSKKQKNKQEQGPSQKRPRIDARGAPWFNALFPRDEILNSVGGNAISCAAGAPDAVSRAHAAVEAVVSGFAVAMRDMAKRSAADNSSSGGGDSSISSSSNNGGNNGNGNGNGGDSSNDRILKPLLTTITNLNGAIDALPGLDRTPEQQLERLAALSEELKAEQQILSDAVREAEVSIFCKAAYAEKKIRHLL